MHGQRWHREPIAVFIIGSNSRKENVSHFLHMQDGCKSFEDVEDIVLISSITLYAKLDKNK